MALNNERQEKETSPRYQISQADIHLDTQSLNLPEKFIEENRGENTGPLVERPILIVFLIALVFVGVIAYLISRH